MNKKSLLMTVPAVHHHTAFARHVHSVFRDPKLIPDAVAVELGHALVLELVSFLRELKQGTGKKIMLPLMLGIMKRNRFIHPDQSERASLLQEFYHSPLYKLPEELLADRLNFSKWSTLFLSPGDSIIEAVRCAVEMNIPVYGVDLEDFAATKKISFRIEDPQCAGENLSEYGDRVLKYCDAGRDPRIDLNREMFMSSGLKFCLAKHRKVLFTCGIAHWKSIVSLIKDDRIPPLPVFEIQEETEFKRVIVHPSMAAPLMEIMPQITFIYEKNRQPVNLHEHKSNPVNPGNVVRKCLNSVYEEFTGTTNPGKLSRSGAAKWSDIELYEQYLFQLSAVRQSKIPDFTIMFNAAKVMMSDDFCELLIKKLMEVDPDWASQKDFPDLPVISDSTTDQKEINIVESKEIERSWDWSQENKVTLKSFSFGHPWIWPPCESLIYGIAFKAAEISNSINRKTHYSTAFTGSLEGGIDLKSTMRSFIRGEKNIYVSNVASSYDQEISDATNPDPFVLMFSESSDLSLANWSYFTAGSNLGIAVKNKELFEKIKSEKGSVFVSSVILDEKIAPPSRLSRLVFEMSKAIGTVMYGNPCINAKQSAIWLETTGYKCCPIISGYGMPGLKKYFLDNYGLEFNFSDWRETLIRMAIPFAKKMVTILAPDSFHLSELVKLEASKRRISLNIVSHSHFSESQLEEARHRFSINSLDRLGMKFPSETEIILGQTKETYFEMLPYAIRKQVGYDENFIR
jgi:hypothetical protein